MKTIAITTLGCKTNQLESSVIAENFIKSGFKQTDFNYPADFYIINTCTVTSKTDNEAKYLIRKAKRTNPDSKVIVTGCSAQVGAKELEEIQEVDIILGNSEKHNLLEIISESSSKTFVSDIMQQDEFIDFTSISSSGRTRANLKIQDGCNNRCAYCIIPFARGKSRSNTLNNIINQIKSLTNEGYQEIVLTGIHLGQWGADLKPKQNLANLLSEIEKIDSLKRYRLGSLDPLEFTKEVIEILTTSKKFCKHLHISLQSASNKTLKNMRRGYKIEDYAKLVNDLTDKIDGLAIGSDVIVGFPFENEDDIEETYNNLKSLPISYLHVFPYSKRKGTPAAVMEEQVDENIKKMRATRLKELAKEKNTAFINSQINKQQNALVEINRDKKTGKLKALTDNYLTVLIDGNGDLMNNIINIKITEYKNSTCKGIII